ncbi:PglZ domain-containing protein [Methylotuvimicrobium buryatense]|uniref:PglZ domain-containing protein n=1 Tax=Methylotuvimicrobium buryatense TaxID=95641 RepID=A0A4P9UNQ2_METBY|nr:PglZ domain-containing protein [Methylotuvimicrobium buryatense]QCW82110.1 PglZ domain-containing protein [Methylotuvimicrobium buryatense]
MPVQLILDYFGVDADDALCVEPSEPSIAAVTRQIHQYLREQSPVLHRVRLTSQALYHRFEHLEGLDGVLKTQTLIPRALVAEKFKLTLPDWLTNETCVALGLLKNPSIKVPFEAFERNLLYLCGADLISGQSFQAFADALKNQGVAFLLLLESEPIKQTLVDHLEFDLNIEHEIAQCFIAELVASGDISVFVKKLAHQQHLSYLRRFTSYHQLEIALPAQALPSLLLGLPLFCLDDTSANSLVETFSLVLNAAVRKVLAYDIPAEALADLFIADWPELWTETTDSVESHPEIVSDALAQKVATFSSPEASLLAKKLKQASYPLLANSASVEEVLAWSEGYFEYCRHAFSYKQTLDETINGSFADWLLTQNARISRSESYWLYCSQQITKFLNTDYAVVVIMVDALSALNRDVLLAELESLTQQEQLALASETLFAPLPTLTEVGKMAVLTGKPANQLPNDQETALRETYQAFLPEPHSLKVGRSWRESKNEILDAQTKLFVIFENELDERLHDCVSFEKHRGDLKPISHRIKSKIKTLVKDAQQLGRDIVFFITADHGMTVTQAFYEGVPFGDIKERCFKSKVTNTEIPASFVQIDRYVIPKQRWRLTTDGHLAHGGLTPEEVLIPFITLTTKTPELPETHLEVSLENNQARRIDDKHWQIDLVLTSSVTASDICIKINDSVFSGAETVDSLRVNKSQKVALRFNCSNGQEGLIRIELVISYHHSGANEQLIKFIDVNFPASLLKKDGGVQSFEGMF